VEAHLVTGIASERLPPGPPLSCARELQQLRVEREIAAVQREMDRLQELGTNLHDSEITALWRRKEALRAQKEQLSQRVHS
jgi:hypothetical protein